MTDQINRPEDPLDKKMDSDLRKVAGTIHPSPAFTARLRGELDQKAARPRRSFWDLLTRARPWIFQAVLILALVGLVAVAGTLTGQLFAPPESRGTFREIGANLTPSASEPSNITASLPAGALARLGKGKIRSIDTAPDGRIAVGSTAGVCIYNTGFTTDWCRWTDAPVHEVLFDPTGKWLAVHFSNRPVSIEIWDAALGEGIHLAEAAIPVTYTSPNLPNPNFFNINGIAWEPAREGQASRLAMIETGAGVSVWDLQNGALPWGPVPVEGEMIGLEWTTGQEGESIVAVLTPETLHLLDGNTGQIMNSLSGMAGAAPGTFLTLDRASQSSRLAIGADEKISVFDPAAWNVTVYQSIPHPAGRFTNIALSPDGGHIAALTADAQVITFDLRTGQETGRLPTMPLSPLAWNAADGRLYYASPDGSLASFDGRNKPLLIFSEHTLPPQVVAWRKDGMVITAANNYLYTWDPATQKLGSFSEMTLSNSVVAAGISKDGSRVLFFDASSSRMIVWDVAQYQPLHDITVSGFLHAVTLSPDGTRLAAVHESGQIFTWKLLDNGGEQRDMNGLQGFTAVDAMAFHPNGELLAVAYTNGEAGTVLELWNIPLQEKISLIPPGEGVPSVDDPAVRERITDLDWYDNGEHLGASQTSANVIWQYPIWERSAQVPPTAFDPSQELRSFTFNGNQGLAAAGLDVLYYTMGVSEPGLFRGHSMTVTGLAFRPDGEALASASNDGTVILWDLGSASLPPVEIQPTATPLPEIIATSTFGPTFTPITLQEYTVVEGDTCGSIAYTFGISVESLIALNNLSPTCDNLQVGQVLRIPYPTPTPNADYPAPLDRTETAIVEAYPAPGLTITPTPTRTTKPGDPTPLPDATQHPFPDTRGYEVSQTDGISPSGKWRWIAIRGEWTEQAPREEDLNVIIAASTNGRQTWVLEEYTPHGLGEGWPTGFAFSADDRYLFFYESGTPDGCGLPWQANLRRMDLLNGVVDPVPPVTHTPYGQFALSPQVDRLAVVTRTEIEIHDTYALKLIQRIALPEIEVSDWYTPKLHWSPGSSTLVAFELAAPTENPCVMPPADQQRWTVVTDTLSGTAWIFPNPPGYALYSWSFQHVAGAYLGLTYQAKDGSTAQVDPITGEVIP